MNLHLIHIGEAEERDRDGQTYRQTEAETETQREDSSDTSPLRGYPVSGGQL